MPWASLPSLSYQYVLIIKRSARIYLKFRSKTPTLSCIGITASSNHLISTTVLVVSVFSILNRPQSQRSSQSYFGIDPASLPRLPVSFLSDQRPALVKLKALRKQQSIEHVVVSQGHGHRPLYLCMANSIRLLITLSIAVHYFNEQIASIQILARTSFKGFCCPVWFRYQPSNAVVLFHWLSVAYQMEYSYSMDRQFLFLAIDDEGPPLTLRPPEDKTHST